VTEFRGHSSEGKRGWGLSSSLFEQKKCSFWRDLNNHHHHLKTSWFFLRELPLRLASDSKNKNCAYAQSSFDFPIPLPIPSKFSEKTMSHCPIPIPPGFRRTNTAAINYLFFVEGAATLFCLWHNQQIWTKVLELQSSIFWSLRSQTEPFFTTRVVGNSTLPIM